MTTTALAPIDLIHAHQATLNYLASNHPHPSSVSVHVVAENDQAYLTPDTRAGATLLRMIANAMGKPVTSDNVLEIALYLRGC